MSACAPMRVGIIGVGYGAAVLAPAFRSVARCSVDVLAATSEARAADAAARAGVPRAAGSWRAVVDDPALGAVAVAVPPSRQAEIIEAALRQGKHVFAEKPLAVDLASAARLWSLARESGRAHVIDFEFLEDPAWAEAERWVRSGGLGRVRTGAVTWQIQTYAHRERLVNWKSGAEGGALALFGSHVLHHVERLAGPVARVSCRLTPAAHAAQGGDADVQAILQLVDGGSVAVAIGADSPGGSGHRLELHGDRGSLLLDNPTRDHLRGFRLRFGAREADVAEPRAVPAPPEDRWPRDGRIYAVSRLASRFVDWALGGPVARPDFGDGLRVQALMDAAQRSHATSSWTEPNVDG